MPTNDQSIEDEIMLTFNLDDHQSNFNLSLQFYILKLQGVGLVICKLLTQILHSHVVDDGVLNDVEFNLDLWDSHGGTLNGVGW